ncbi:unnamed protein product [marine sediment metagenome]|uniref:Uncharacterized protein n=1 Tax=marine sediment metagenome TaxID=412755 RepID=X1DRX9_9ZZZZ
MFLIRQKVQINKRNLSVVQKTSFGEIKISIGSIKRLALKVIKGMGEITETRSEVNILKSGGINIDLHLFVKQDVNIPELSEKIQRKVKEYILETSGIETKEAARAGFPLNIANISFSISISLGDFLIFSSPYLYII